MLLVDPYIGNDFLKHKSIKEVQDFALGYLYIRAVRYRLSENSHIKGLEIEDHRLQQEKIE